MVDGYCWYYRGSYCDNSTIRGVAFDRIGHRAGRAGDNNAVHKDRITANIEKERTQESEPTTSKLVDDLNVTASPCHVGDSRYSTIQSTLLIHTSFIPTCVLRTVD